LRAMKRFVLALTFLAATATAQLKPADFAGLRDVGTPRLSPDGNWIVYTVKQAFLPGAGAGGADLNADDKNRTHIWLASWDGKENRQLTFSKESESTPEWSPDGKLLAFLSSRGTDDELDQLWVMHREGGEAERVSEFKGSVVDYAWSPDGRRLTLVVEDPEPEADADKGKDKDKKDKTKPPIVINRFQFKEDRVGYLTTKRQHLYLFDLATKKSEPLTSGAFNEALPSWSPDGSQLAFVSKRGDDFDRTNDWNLYVVEGKSGATPRQLTNTLSETNAAETESRPAWSADGKSIAFMERGDPKLIYYSPYHLAAVPAAGGETRIVTPSLDRPVSNPTFEQRAAGAAIDFIVQNDRLESLARVTNGRVETIAGGVRTILDYDEAGGHIVIRASDDLHPPELFTSDNRQLTHHNDEWLAAHKLGATQALDFKSKDGTEIHGFVVTPPDYDKSKKYPAVLRIHGGPVSQFSHRFNFEWQLLATNGYVVVAANPRGSSGRGEAFAKAIYADWGRLDAQDVLAAVDTIVARGLADPQRLGVGGWSYGGMLTNYTIATDKRFKAATSGASIANILAGYGTDEYVREYEAELGRPWEHPDVWMRISFPFLHADRITTPTLFLAGQNDFNVPLLNSEQMYQALRSLGVPTELVIYPGQYHGITKPSYVRDRYQRYLDWYGKYLK
jgi:dipeptidyl aminopeptidase/acylaminoacyl peptidase